MNTEDIKFYLFLSFPFILFAVLLFFLFFSKRIPSPVFLYKFFSAIAAKIRNFLAPVKRVFSNMGYALSKILYGHLFIEKTALPQEILNRIGPSNCDKILSAIKVVPHIRLTKNKKKILRTVIIISNEYVYFLLYIKGRPIIEMDRLLLKNISVIEAKSKEVMGLYKRPFISMKASDNTEFCLMFPSHKIGIESINDILDILKKAQNDLKIVTDLPEDFRSDAINSFIKANNEASNEIKQEMNKDLNDLFK